MAIKAAVLDGNLPKLAGGSDQTFYNDGPWSGHSRGLDGDATLLFVLPGVRDPRLSGLGRGDDAGLGDERVRQGGLSVINVRDDGHVADVVLLVHDRPDLVDREVHLRPEQWRVSHAGTQRIARPIIVGNLRGQH